MLKIKLIFLSLLTISCGDTDAIDTCSSTLTNISIENIGYKSSLISWSGDLPECYPLNGLYEIQVENNIQGFSKEIIINTSSTNTNTIKFDLSDSVSVPTVTLSIHIFGDIGSTQINPIPIKITKID